MASPTRCHDCLTIVGHSETGLRSSRKSLTASVVHAVNAAPLTDFVDEWSP
jgi:hypothetical protein